MHSKNPQNIINANNQLPIHKQILQLFLSVNIHARASITISETNNAYEKKDNNIP